MILDTVNTTLELLTSAALSLDYVVDYEDSPVQALSPLARQFTPGRSSGNTTTATTTTIVAAPDANNCRYIRTVTLRNRDGASTNNVTLKLDISGTEYRMTPEVALLTGEVLVFTDREGFWVINASGQRKTV